MDIAIILMPMWSVKNPPLGLSYIGASLRDDNHNVRLIDLNALLFNDYKKEKKQKKIDLWDGGHVFLWQREDQFKAFVLPEIKNIVIKRCNELIKSFIKDKIKVVGFSVYATNVLMVEYMVKYLKNKLPYIKIILGGPEASNETSLNLLKEKIVDCIIPSEGEQVVKEYIRAIENGLSVEKITGLKLRNNDGGINFLYRKPVAMDLLPIVSFRNLDWELYSEKEIPIMMSRGCVGKCSFCNEPAFWGKFRWRSPEHIIKEIEQNLLETGLSFFLVQDSLLNGNLVNLKKTISLIKKSKLQINFGGNARVSKKMDRNIIKDLSEVGCSFLIFGIESGSSRILKLMKKNIKLDWAIDNLKHCFEFGISVQINLIVGFPGEKETDFQETIVFLKKIIPYIKIVNVGLGMGIGAGQDVYENPANYDIKLDDEGRVFIDSAGNWLSRDELLNNYVINERLVRLKSFLRDNNVEYAPNI